MMALLTLLTTPIDSVIPSPAEILFGRRIMGNMPTAYKINDPATDITARLRERQQAMKEHHDRSAKDLPPLKVGTSVVVRDHTKGTWLPEIVKEVGPEPRSYMVQFKNDSVLRRNRIDIRETRARRRVTFDLPPYVDLQPPDANYTPPTAVAAEIDPPAVQEVTAPRDTNQEGAKHTRCGRRVTAPQKLTVKI